MFRHLLLAGLVATAVACGPSSSVDRAESVDAAGGSSAGAGGRGGTGGSTGGAGGAGSGGAGGSEGGGAGGSTGGAGGSTGGASGGAGGSTGGTSGGAGGSGGAAGGGMPDAPVVADLAPDTGAPDGAVEALMQVAHTGGAAVTNLTQAGTLDWVHFGLGGASNSNRKRNAEQLVTMYPISSGSIGRYDDRPVAFSWNDGAPTAAASSVTDGIVVGDVTGRGFEIRALGSPERPRTLKVHVGVWGARAKMAIQLSDGGVLPYMDSSLDASAPGQDRIYTIVFRPRGDGQFLSVRWTIDRINKTYGNVTLQAASLTE
jgi:hypothetical protein